MLVFVKHKTSYYLRISDWSSDVGSSDLILSITMAAVGIGLGVVGLIGYQSMKDGALEQASRVAEKVATDAASRHMENIRQSVEGLQSGDVHQAVEPTSIEPYTAEKE